MSYRLRWIVLAAAASVCAGAHAAQEEAKVPSPATKVTRELVVQKELFVTRILADSPAVRRIEGSINAKAKKHLAVARDSHRKAVLSIRSGDFASADRQLNEATWLIGKARQLVPDPRTRDIEHRMRYAQMLNSVESLRVSYQRHLQQVRDLRPGEPVGDARLARATDLIERAKRLANGEQLPQANQTLDDAERVLMLGLSQVLGGKTIEYALRFDTPSEEYAYELERNRSYSDLVPIALAAFKPGSEAIREVQHRVDTNRQLREQARRLAGKKDHRAALAALRSGTAHLQNALAAAGLRVPRDPGPK